MNFRKYSFIIKIVLIVEIVAFALYLLLGPPRVGREPEIVVTVTPEPTKPPIYDGTLDISGVPDDFMLDNPLLDLGADNVIITCNNREYFLCDIIEACMESGDNDDNEW